MNENDSNIIVLERIVKNYNSLKALDGVTLKVKRGEMYGLIGPDGAGKTTLIRIMLGLIKADSGNCWIKDFDIRKEKEKTKLITGYMSQRVSLYEDLTVEENMRFFSDLFKVPHPVKAERIEKLLQFSRLSPFRKRKSRELSGGMKKKLALSCTLIHTPEILFLDEPTTGVDPVSRREFWNILRSLLKERVTIFITTPYMDEAEYCDRISFIQGGKITATGKPEEVKDLYPYDLFEIRTVLLSGVPGVIKDFKEVKSIQIFGDSLHVSFKKGAFSEKEIEKILYKRGFEKIYLKKIKPGIGDVFLYLMG
ncbi:MAG: ABC transporter ATP-binding protein [Fidelibacterota bacterium]